MGLFYYASFSGVTISAAQDLFSIQSGANRCFKLHEFTINPDNVTSTAEVRLAIKRVTGTLTNGSGGSAITFAQSDPNTVAATITGRMNDTTRLSQSGGAITTLVACGMNLLNGWQFMPLPEYKPSFILNQAMVIGLETAPASSTWSAYAVVEEGIF